MCRRNRLLSALIMVVFFSLSAAVTATVVFGVSQYWSNEKLRVAKESAERSQHKTAEMAGLLAWEKGRDLCNDAKVGLGLLWMARALETMPLSSEATTLQSAKTFQVGLINAIILNSLWHTLKP